MVLRNAKQLEGHVLQARDGLIGRVKDFYFDDAHWRVRYCVVETGEWLQSRRVLVSPTAMRPYDAALKVFPVDLTKEQVRHSPDVGTEVLVSRQHEEAIHRHYGWLPYWGSVLGGAPILPVVSPTPTVGESGESVAPEGERPLQKRTDPFLRSMNDTIGYHLDATDGTLGHVEDFLVHGEDWTIRYLVVDTRNGWPGKRVVLAPEWIAEVNWEKSRVAVDLTREMIDQSPVYDPSTPWADYGSRLDDYYRSLRQRQLVR